MAPKVAVNRILKVVLTRRACLFSLENVILRLTLGVLRGKQAVSDTYLVTTAVVHWNFSGHFYLSQLWDFQALSEVFYRETAARPAARGVRIRVHSLSRDSVEAENSPTSCSSLSP